MKTKSDLCFDMKMDAEFLFRHACDLYEIALDADAGETCEHHLAGAITENARLVAEVVKASVALTAPVPDVVTDN